MASNLEQLSKRIEQVIQEHVAESRRVAIAAMARGFASAGGKAGTRTRQRANAQNHRGELEIAGLAEQLYRVLCEKPGESLAVFAAEIGVTPRELERPLMKLRLADQVRSVGSRSMMRYFPLTARPGR